MTDPDPPDHDVTASPLDTALNAAGCLLIVLLALVIVGWGAYYVACVAAAGPDPAYADGRSAAQLPVHLARLAVIPSITPAGDSRERGITRLRN